MKRTGPTNVYLRRMIRLLRRAYRTHGAKIWLAISEKLDRPRRRRIVVNVGKIAALTKENDVVVVPGKVLGAGEINHPVTVAAVGFSKNATEKIVRAGGKCLSILELVELNPKGKNVKIIGG